VGNFLYRKRGTMKVEIFERETYSTCRKGQLRFVRVAIQLKIYCFGNHLLSGTLQHFLEEITMHQSTLQHSKESSLFYSTQRRMGSLLFREQERRNKKANIIFQRNHSRTTLDLGCRMM